jgi:hypothetical protein
MGADALDADLIGRLFDYRPDRPVAQPLSDPSGLADGAQQPPCPSPAADVQTSMSFFTDTGMATVRILPSLPRRSAITQRP